MEKREKIIVVMVIIAALYGAIDFTLTSKKKKSARVAPDAQPVTVAVAPEELQALNSADSIKLATIAVSINESWPKQIFALGPINFDDETKIDENREALLNELRAKISQLYYSGFVSMADDRIAIINNMDYRVGEQVEGFTITKITMDSIKVTASDASFDIPAATELPPSESGQPPPKPE